MVVTREMEKTVYQQSFQFFIQRESIFCRLPLCPVDIDYDITQNNFVIRDS